MIKELGLSQLLNYAYYQYQLRSHQFERSTPAHNSEAQIAPVSFAQLQPFAVSALLTADKSRPFSDEIIKQADEISNGFFCPFGGNSAPLNFTLPKIQLEHWSHYGDELDGKDIKEIWEPARFSWVFPLCQAYLITKDEKYPCTFWKNFEAFLQANPVNQGPNWASAQEVALRMIPWLLAAQVFGDSVESTLERMQQLTRAFWQHTRRIPPTLHYARSQNNNHLLSEALGLVIGGLVFRDTPQGKKWLQQGNHEFQNAVLHQIEADGTYSQHSTNYHRLMLHLALLFQYFTKPAGIQVQKRVLLRLAQATSWLIAQYDEQSGYLPNLGHNDGSNLLPLGCSDYRDYRPTIQAASLAFFGKPYLPPGPWDQLSGLLGLAQTDEKTLTPGSICSRAIHRVGTQDTWGSLRTAHFHSRPAHADLLHVDLWWQGINIAADAGTYSYNSPAPWENALAATEVHNTLTVVGQDQMVRAGKFLWLERAQAQAFPPQTNQMIAILYCNLPFAYTQIRTLEYQTGHRFVIRDQVDLTNKLTQTVKIQWLLPDWPWHFQNDNLVLEKNGRSIHMQVGASDNKKESHPVPGVVSLIRAGETLLGESQNPIRGWVSNTYNEKTPALSYSLTFDVTKTIEIKSIWILTKS